MSTEPNQAEPPQNAPEKPGEKEPPRRTLLLVFFALAVAVLGLTLLAGRIVQGRAMNTAWEQEALIDRALMSPGTPLVDRFLPAGVLVVDLVPLSPRLGLPSAATIVIDSQQRTWNDDVRARFEGLSPGRRYSIAVRGPYFAEPLAISLPDPARGARVALRAIPLTPPRVERTGEYVPQTPEKSLVVDMTRRDTFDIRWVQGQTTVSLVELPRGTQGLGARFDMEWKQQGGHRDPSDRRVDQATIRALPGAPFNEVLAMAQAILSPTREMRDAVDRHTIPAFDLTVDTATPIEAKNEADPLAAELAAAAENPHRSAKVRMGALQVSGRLPPEVIQRIVRQNYGRFRLCYEVGLRKDPSLQGRVAVRFVIGADGAVSNVQNGGSDLPDAAVVQCIVRAFYGLSFPRPERGIVTATYPIMLSPG